MILQKQAKTLITVFNYICCCLIYGRIFKDNNGHDTEVRMKTMESITQF